NVPYRSDRIHDFAGRPGPRDPDDAHVEGLAAPRDLRADSAEPQDHDGGAGQRLVGHALIEDAPPDFVGPEDDVLRGRKEQGHCMLGDRHTVRARVAAHDGGWRKSIEREMVYSGDERLNPPALSCLLPAV